jgi:hypothetical protein
MGRPAYRRAFRYVAAVAVVPALAGLYVLAHGALPAAFADVILYPARQYSLIQGVPFGYGIGPLRSPLKFIPPLAALMLVAVCIVDWRQAWRSRALWTSTALALAGFLGTYPRPDLVHIAFTLPLILPLAVTCASLLATAARPLRTYWLIVTPVAAFALLCCLPCTVWFYRDLRSALEAPLTPTARGPAALREAGAADLVRQLSAETGATFFYPYMPMLPYLTGKDQVSRYDVFVPHYTTAQQFAEACEAMWQHAAIVVVNTKWTDGPFLRTVFPSLTGFDVNQQAFDQALNAGFATQWQSGTFEVLRRRAGVLVDVCQSKHVLF